MQEEFEALWNHRDARKLSDAIVEDVERILSRKVVAVARWTPEGKEPAPFIEAPVARQGAGWRRISGPSSRRWLARSGPLARPASCLRGRPASIKVAWPSKLIR